MVSTTMFFSPVVPVMKSNDLVSWEICNYVCDTYADDYKEMINFVDEKSFSITKRKSALTIVRADFAINCSSYAIDKSS